MPEKEAAKQSSRYCRIILANNKNFHWQLKHQQSNYHEYVSVSLNRTRQSFIYFCATSFIGNNSSIIVPENHYRTSAMPRSPGSARFPPAKRTETPPKIPSTPISRRMHGPERVVSRNERGSPRCRQGPKQVVQLSNAEDNGVLDAFGGGGRRLCIRQRPFIRYSARELAQSLLEIILFEAGRSRPNETRNRVNYSLASSR